MCYDISHSTTDLSSEGSDMIRISPAYYDADPIEGPATSPYLCTNLAQASLTRKTAAAMRHTAPPLCSSTHSTALQRTSAITNFPARTSLFQKSSSGYQNSTLTPSPSLYPLPSTRVPIPHPPPPTLQPDVLYIEPETPAPELGKSPKALIRRIQSKCSINKWMVIIGGTPEDDSAPSSLDEKLPVHDTVVKPKVDRRAKTRMSP